MIDRSEWRVPREVKGEKEFMGRGYGAAVRPPGNR